MFASMTIETASRLMITSMGERYDEREASAITMLVMEHLTSMTRGLQIIHKTDQLTEENAALFNKFLTELKNGRPVQYVLGQAWFGGMPFYVDENVLVPRPETEELVDWLLKDLTGFVPGLSILDIGTGSGCIPIYLKKKQPGFNLAAIDISEPALEIAVKNAATHKTTVDFFQCDIRYPMNWEKIKPVDILISNPPYIPEKQRSELAPHVRDFEPDIALFVPDDDPIIFYKIISVFAGEKLKKGGSVFLEIHHDFARPVMEWYEKNNYHLELKKDFSGNNRMIKAVRLY
jgi:release factor glutamine methyltransferase